MKADRLAPKCLQLDFLGPHALRSLRPFAGVILFFSATFAVHAGNLFPSEAVDIGSRLELFVDEYLIDSMSGVSCGCIDRSSPSLS